MHVRMILAVSSSLLLAAGSTAAAQSSFSLCTGSGARSCAWVEVNATTLGPGSIQLTVRAQNLQGIAGGGTTGPSVLDRIFLNFTGPMVPDVGGLTEMPTAGPGVTSYDGTGDLGFGVPQPWSAFDTNGLFTLTLLADNPDAGYNTDILGCDGPSPFEDPGFRTCGAPGDEWVQFLFTVGADLDESQLASVGFGVRYGLGSADQHICNDAPNANVTCGAFAPSVVPEPATVLLLGSGLGILALGTLRRRERQS